LQIVNNVENFFVFAYLSLTCLITSYCSKTLRYFPVKFFYSITVTHLEAIILIDCVVSKLKVSCIIIKVWCQTYGGISSSTLTSICLPFWVSLKPTSLFLEQFQQIFLYLERLLSQAGFSALRAFELERDSITYHYIARFTTPDPSLYRKRVKQTS